MSSQFFHHSKDSRGFGLIELMVSIGVMALVAGVLLVRQNAFNGAVLLEGQAYKIALSIREVQTQAVSASAIAGSTREMLGVYFDTNRRTVYKTFRDDEGNGSYDVSEDYGPVNSLDSRFEIKTIRVQGVAQNNVAIMFKRPNFDAQFYVDGVEIPAGQVEIEVGTIDASTAGVKTAVVTATGQISVQ